MVFWRPLSAKLLIYNRVALFRASAIAPANDILPCLVKDDFRAPVPAYILDRASPLSAQRLECRIQKSGAASFTSMAKKSLNCHLGDDCLDQIRPVQTIKAVCSKNTFLLQDNNRSPACLLTSFFCGVFYFLREIVCKTIGRILNEPSNQASRFVTVWTLRLGMKIKLRLP